MKKPPKSNDPLGDLLAMYGIGRLNDAGFWRQMEAAGFTQDDIDRWLDNFYEREKS